jgi:kynureninase
VRYEAGARAFGGATYDPTSHYRAAAVFDFFRNQGLTAHTLHAINRHQVQLLKTEFERLDGPPSVAYVEPMPDERRGGFLAIGSREAVGVARQLRAHGVHCDARGNVLRLGPAPYLRDDQLRDAIRILGQVLGFRN